METHIAPHPPELAWPQTTEGQLAIDLFETDNAVIVVSAIAGVTHEALDIFINPDMITIRGTRACDTRDDNALVHTQECFWGSFSRTIILPCHVQSNRSTARMSHGVLTITCPKQSHEGRRIAIGR